MKNSKWRIVGMDAADHNAITDGPNPNGPDFQDNAGNSFEQEVAVKTWVDAAVDMLNRGEEGQAVLAKLAHDGCPDPEGVLQRAIDQQIEQPITDEAGLNPDPLPATALPPDDSSFGAPPRGVSAATNEWVPTPEDVEFVKQARADDPVRHLGDYNPVYTYPESPHQQGGIGMSPDETAATQELSGMGIEELKQRLAEAEASGDLQTAEQLRALIRSQWSSHYNSKVKIGSATVTLLDMYEDIYGHNIARIAAENGEVEEVNAADLEETEQPVDEDSTSDIQKFIDTFPEVEPNKLSSLKAAEANWEQVKELVNERLASVPRDDLHTMAKLGNYNTRADFILTDVRDNISQHISSEDHDYLLNQPAFQVGREVSSQGGQGYVTGEVDLDNISREMEADALDIDYEKVVTEDSAIMVSEVPAVMLDDVDGVHAAAISYIDSKTAGLVDENQRTLLRDRFVQNIEHHREARLALLPTSEPAPISKTATVDSEMANAPIESLFM